ncbi:MAG: hypothetical protein ACLTER_12785 [Ruminococcus sp.]
MLKREKDSDRVLEVHVFALICKGGHHQQGRQSDYGSGNRH